MSSKSKYFEYGLRSITQTKANSEKRKLVPIDDIENVTSDKNYEGKKVKWQPNDWHKTLDNIRKMREKRDAPVDTMGCEKCKGENYSEKEKRYHILISLMLSSQTKDHVTHAAMGRLLEEGLTVEHIMKISNEKLGSLIRPVGFWKSKVKYVKESAIVLKNEYNCDIPESVDELVKLPGIGPKMAYLTMNCAWNKVVGIGVDVHVHRITNRLGWTKKQTKNPEQTRKELEEWLPQCYWKEANWLLVGFGQQICMAKPNCDECLNNNICPSSKVRKRHPKVKEKS